ncbi:hypothetical protein QQZ08_000432 [Neonectria magnoliae]|uniref:Uncharacterized protein n=1 Tax=Neonectria magnoliae TaxID=2732573 RepID=A0ABR1IJY9_9HYPO
MNTALWQLFEASTGKHNLSTPVLEVTDILENILALPDADSHLGILHMYIHIVEMSETPERAVIPADHLRSLLSDGGYIHHMPSHIDVLVRNYRRAIHTNKRATVADDLPYAWKWVENFYSFYRMYSSHSLINGAMVAGNSKAALEAVDRMEVTITDGMLRVQYSPLASWLEFFNSIRVHVLVRFGLWDSLKSLLVPEEKCLYCVPVAITHYGKSIAYAVTGNVEEADHEREIFREAAKRVPRQEWPSPSTSLKLPRPYSMAKSSTGAASTRRHSTASSLQLHAKTL